MAEQLSLHKGLRVVLSDGLQKFSWGQKAHPSFMFFLLSHYLIPFYNIAYRLTDNRYGLKLLRTGIRLMWGKHIRQIIRREKPDLIITTHHFISPSIWGPANSIPSVVMVLDLGRPHRIWFDEQAKAIIVPDIKMAQWAKKKFGFADGQIKPIGYPLKRNFTVLGTNKSAQNRGFKNQILILGSGIRSFLIKGWIEKIKKNLPDKKLTIVCGHNRLLRRRLANVKDVEVLGFIDHLHQLIKESDLVITKSGPATIMEAGALRKPVILVKWVGLQEKHNVDFVMENNLGIYDPNGENLTSSIAKIYKNFQKYTVNKTIKPFDTEKIVDYLLKL